MFIAKQPPNGHKPQRGGMFGSVWVTSANRACRLATGDTADWQSTGSLCYERDADCQSAVSADCQSAWRSAPSALPYLNITGLEVALLVNFKESKLNWKRVVRGEPEVA